MALDQVGSHEVALFVVGPAPPPTPDAARPSTGTTPPANSLATAVPLLLQLGLSGAIKILGPAAAPATARSHPHLLLAFKFYALAEFLTFALDMLLVIYLIAEYAGVAKPPLRSRAMKPLMIAALAVAFATVILATVLNILA